MQLFYDMAQSASRGARRSAITAAALAGAVALTLSSLPAQAAGKLVAFDDLSAKGTIVVHTSERRLYLLLGSGRALQYVVGVGRSKRQWAGKTTISGKYLRPNWAPPASIKRDKPNLPELIPGGSPRNPMGVAAMTLSGGEYAIHGTNAPRSIGKFVSYGCIRMRNADISDLYGRVFVGTPVVVLR